MHKPSGRSTLFGHSPFLNPRPKQADAKPHDPVKDAFKGSLWTPHSAGRPTK